MEKLVNLIEILRTFQSIPGHVEGVVLLDGAVDVVDTDVGHDVEDVLLAGEELQHVQIFFVGSLLDLLSWVDIRSSDDNKDEFFEQELKRSKRLPTKKICSCCSSSPATSLSTSSTAPSSRTTTSTCPGMD